PMILPMNIIGEKFTPKNGFKRCIKMRQHLLNIHLPPLPKSMGVKSHQTIDDSIDIVLII
ncbi:MAG: hypothetical protein ACJA01_002583, partial [Saprospiraceae bacterium]